MLSTKDGDRIATAVLSRIRTRPLPLPTIGEREPTFTARVLMPRVREALADIDISGLTLAGDGAATPPIISLPSCEFIPDIALLYRMDRIVAFEVKFLRKSGRQQSLSAAIGQATLYRGRGYKSVGIVLVDLAPVPTEAQKICALLSSVSFFGQVFSKSGANLISAA